MEISVSVEFDITAIRLTITAQVLRVDCMFKIFFFFRQEVTKTHMVVVSERDQLCLQLENAKTDLAALQVKICSVFH